MNKYIEEINEHNEKIEKIYGKISKSMEKEINELDQIFKIKWVFKLSSDGIARDFYKNRIAYSCFKIEENKYDLFFNTSYNEYQLIVNDSFSDSFSDIDLLWKEFAKIIKETLPKQYEKFIRMKKIMRLMD